MALELKQGLKLSQNLVMTPQLQQAIKLLQLNRMELAEMITSELTENPILEEMSESIDENGNTTQTDLAPLSSAESEQSQYEADTQKEKQSEEIDWQNYLEEYNSFSSSSLPSTKDVGGDDLPSFENVLTKTKTLEDHLLWQLSMEALTDDEKVLGEMIIGNLNQDGYFVTANLEDLANESQVHIEDAEEILKIIQNFDPVGVGARDLKECLLLQARKLEPVDETMIQVLENHLSDLEKKNYAPVAKALGKSIDEIHNTVRAIMELEPKPGRSFHTGDDTHYITPDIYVHKVGNEYVIALNDDGIPRLKISPYYRNILSQANQSNSKTTKEYVKEKLQSAVWLIRSIHNRQKTIFKVTETIVKRQRDFFEKGPQFLKPMILKDVANDIGMHESTVSRVTTNKYVHTPIGIFELKYFFNSSIQAADGTDALASEAVKEKIKQMVAKEDPKNPLSDQKISEILKKDNIDIARRTVAKYRDMLGILSSSKRKKVL